MEETHLKIICAVFGLHFLVFDGTEVDLKYVLRESPRECSRSIVSDQWGKFVTQLNRVHYHYMRASELDPSEIAKDERWYRRPPRCCH